VTKVVLIRQNTLIIDWKPPIALQPQYVPRLYVISRRGCNKWAWFPVFPEKTTNYMII